MLNTLTIAHNLTDSGFEREQAEAIANVVADVAKSEHGDLASKEFVRSQISAVRGEIAAVRGEIAAVRGDMKTEIAAVRGEISAVRGDMSKLETRLIRWIVGTGIGAAGLAAVGLTIVFRFIL